MKELIAIFGIVGVCFGAYFFIENRYALSADVRKIEQRLDYKIVADQLRSVQDRIWQIQDRCGSKEPTDKTAKEELRKLQEDKLQLTEKLKAMEKK